MSGNSTGPIRTGADTAQEIATSVLLFFLVFGFAATVHFDNFKASLKSKAIVVGLCSQFLLMPLIGFAFVSLVPVEPYVVVIVLVITSSPGGSYSNLYTSFFNGDLALSVAMTTVSTLCALFMLPLNLALYISAVQAIAPAGGPIEVDWIALGRTTAIVVVAVCMGIVANMKTPQYSDYYNAFAQLCGTTQIIFALVSSQSDQPLWEYEFGVYIVTILPCAVGLSVAVFVGLCLRLDKPKVFTIGMEVCMQNLTIAIAVAYSAFSGAEASRAAAITVLYGVGNFIFATSFAFFALFMGWTFTPEGERNLLKIIARNYQPKPSDGVDVTEHATTNAIYDSETGKVEVNTKNAPTL